MLDVPEALQSEYLKYNINEAIFIYEGKFAITYKEREVGAIGKIYIDWYPTPNLKFDGKVSEGKLRLFEMFNDDRKGSAFISVPGYLTREALVLNIEYVNSYIKISGIIINILENIRSSQIMSLKFCMVNFTNTFGTPIKNKSFYYRGRYEFIYDKWKIILDLRSDKDYVKNLKQLGGYGVTHIGLLQCRDGELFSYEEVECLLESLRWLLSFACGRYVGICVVNGIKDNEIVWNRYQVPKLSNCKTKQTWFSEFETGDLEKVFTTFFEKIQSPMWGKVLKIAIDWYIESLLSEKTIESNMVTVQIALEMLAWTYLVQEKEVFSKSKYERLKASDKLRYMLKEFCINNQIPDFDEAKKLVTLYDDGPHMITDFRNSIVHPKKTELDEISVKAKWKILQLGIQYLELSILFLIGYTGYYCNRLQAKWVGDKEIVPWEDI